MAISQIQIPFDDRRRSKGIKTRDRFIDGKKNESNSDKLSQSGIYSLNTRRNPLKYPHFIKEVVGGIIICKRGGKNSSFAEKCNRNSLSTTDLVALYCGFSVVNFWHPPTDRVLNLLPDHKEHACHPNNSRIGSDSDPCGPHSKGGTGSHSVQWKLIKDAGNRKRIVNDRLMNIRCRIFGICAGVHFQKKPPKLNSLTRIAYEADKCPIWIGNNFSFIFGR